jgi:hypothetical protein
MIVIQEDILQSRGQLFELNRRGFMLDLLLQVLKFCLSYQTNVVSNIV